MQDKNLKAYARYDGSGRAVPGSLVLRKKKPSGNFKEIKTYECCTDVTVTYDTGNPAISLIDLVILNPDGTTKYTGYTNQTSTDDASLQSILQGAFPMLGTWTVSSGVVSWTVPYEVYKYLSPRGSLSFRVEAD